MSPFIKDGDWVTVAPKNGSSPRFGDVVAFFQSGTKKLSIHRVIGKKGTFRFIKGDNTSQLDGLIPEMNILGYVTKVEREGKRIHLGFGPERLFVALFSRGGILSSLLGSICKIMKPLRSQRG